MKDLSECFTGQVVGPTIGLAEPKPGAGALQAHILLHVVVHPQFPASGTVGSHHAVSGMPGKGNAQPGPIQAPSMSGFVVRATAQTEFVWKRVDSYENARMHATNPLMEGPCMSLFRHAFGLVAVTTPQLSQ